MSFSDDVSIFFFFNDTATTEIYTLSLHDALPIFISAQNSSNSSMFYLLNLQISRIVNRSRSGLIYHQWLSCSLFALNCSTRPQNRLTLDPIYHIHKRRKDVSLFIVFL